MRLYISHEKPYLVFLLADYMGKLLADKKVHLVINGKEVTGRVTSVRLEEAPHQNILVSVGEHTFKIPTLNDTKARLGKEMIRVETDNHSTIIEMLD